MWQYSRLRFGKMSVAQKQIDAVGRRRSHLITGDWEMSGSSHDERAYEERLRVEGLHGRVTY